jgi:hypothetical protein
MRARCCCTPSPAGQPAGVALLSAVSSCSALGAATLKQFKHLARR